MFLVQLSMVSARRIGCSNLDRAETGALFFYLYAQHLHSASSTLPHLMNNVYEWAPLFASGAFLLFYFVFLGQSVATNKGIHLRTGNWPNSPLCEIRVDEAHGMSGNPDQTNNWRSVQCISISY